VGLTLSAVALVAAQVAAANRLRRSFGVERQQMKWFALASGFAVVALPLSAALWAVIPLVHPLPAIALTGWPVAMGTAILRYRLYDIDLLITRTVDMDFQLRSSLRCTSSLSSGSAPSSAPAVIRIYSCQSSPPL
jgi:hypothetical protein